VEFEIAPTDNTVILTAVEGAEAQAGLAPYGWHGTLTLRGEQVNKGLSSADGGYVAFGTLQEFDTVGEGIEMTLNAMESAGGGPSGAGGYPSWLGFLLTGPSTGANGNDLRSYGVYVHVAGLTEEYWATLLESNPGGSLMASSAAAVAGAEYDAAMPTPATPLLLLAGMVGWRLMRLRSQGAPASG
jgi:hypothetical protein